MLFVLALALRLVYLWELHGSPLGNYLLGDGVAYDAWAHRIAAGDWFGSEVFYQAPFYPYALGVLYALGASLVWVRVTQAIVGAASCLLVAMAGRRFFGWREGLAAGFLVAVYPSAIFFDGEIQKASFDLLFGAILLVLLAAIRECPAWWRALATGAVVGLFALNRENALLLIPLLAAWLLFLPAAGRTKRIAISLVFLAGTAALLLPVALRNRAIGGELLLTTSQLGPNLYIGNHAGASGRYEPLRAGRGSARYEREDATELAEAALKRELTPAEVSRYWVDRVGAFVRDHPMRWARLMARKWFLLWNRREIVDTTSIETAADVSRLLRWLGMLLHFGVVCPLAIAGMWLTRQRWRRLAVLYLMLGAWAIAITAFYVLARYRYPMVPILALFAGAAIIEVAAAAKRRDAQHLLMPAALALATAIFVNWPADARDPRAPTYASLGNAMAEAGDVDGGKLMLERAVALSPRFAEAHMALGHLRYESGDLDGAEASYRSAVALDPSLAAAWNNLGLIASHRGHIDDAVSMFQRAVQANPGEVSALHNLAQIAFQKGDLATARELFRRVVALDDRDATAHHQLGNLDAFRGDFAAARGEYEKALSIDPSLADAHFKLAIVLGRLGESSEGARHLERAIALESGYEERALRIAQSAEQGGRREEAEILYRLLLAAVPGHPQARQGLERLDRGAAPPRP